MNRISRMEEKRVLKKGKRHVRFALLILFLLLVSGVVATDYALRDMMALFDGDQLFSYSRELSVHNLQLMGLEFYVDQEMVYESIIDYMDWTKDKSKVIFDTIKGLVGKMSG